MKLKGFFCSLVFLMSTLAVAAINPDKHIVSHAAGGEMLVFVKPRKMAKTPVSAASKPLEYDITLATQTDSVTVTYTLIAKSADIKADSTNINGLLSFPNERLYIEPKSKNWVYRLRFKMPSDNFRQTFCADSPLELTVGNCSFSIPQAKQAKEAEICRAAQTIIDLNKK